MVRRRVEFKSGRPASKTTALSLESISKLNSMADMMTNILKLNRLENQQIYPQVTEFDLGEQLCECLLQYENIWEKAEIEIETDIAENVKVKADAELLSHVWNNLFSNAFKFTPSGGTVTVSLTATEHHAVCVCEKNAQGKKRIILLLVVFVVINGAVRNNPIFFEKK